MCGRYALLSAPEALRARFGYAERPDFPPRDPVLPTQPIPIVGTDPLRPGSGTRHFRLVRWGFVPGFVRDFSAFPLIVNARAEEAPERASFRAALMRRRCLVPADRWYARLPGIGARPGTLFRLGARDGRPLAFAGLWEGWMGADGSEIDTACIMTVEATGTAAAIHPRCPAVLPPTQWDAWLANDGTARDRDAALQLLRPMPEEDLLCVEVGQAPAGVSVVASPPRPIHPADTRGQGLLF